METMTRGQALTLAECVVRAARGYERPDGGVVWSGVLWIRETPAANFHNDGNGGCNHWDVRDHALFNAFKALADKEHPEVQFERADWLVGRLWDAAVMRENAS